MIKGGDNDSIHEPGDRQEAPPRRRRASSKRWSAAAPASTPTSAPQASGARRARPRTTATPGSAAPTEEVTACVWVGYADSTTPMTTLYNGGPVMGGTFPALIWASVISAWEQIKAERDAEKASANGTSGGSVDGASSEGEIYVASERLDRSRSGSRTGGTGAGSRHPRRKPKRPRSGAGRTGARTRAGGVRRRHHRGSRPASAGDVGASGEAEAPGALDGFGDPDPRAGDDLAVPAGSGGASSWNGSRERSAPLASRPMPSASVSLPGPEQSSASGRPPRRVRIALEPGGRLAGHGSGPRRPRPPVRRPR